MALKGDGIRDPDSSRRLQGLTWPHAGAHLLKRHWQGAKGSAL